MPQTAFTAAYTGHKYEMPSFTDRMLALCKSAQAGRSFNVCLTGPAGSGKSEFVREIAKMGGFGKVYQVNGRDDMDSSDFYGEKTVVVDAASKQNYITFNKGPLYQAFIEGTEVDADGNQILYDEDGNVTTDGSGNPKVIGKPAIFFMDEFAALLPGVFLSVFNRAMEIPRQRGASRTIEITADGGRIVKSHPNFALFLAGNTVGKGTESESMMGYTAQNNQMDDSTLNRITAFFRFGYNMDAEKSIAYGSLRDDKDVENLLRFRDEIRKQYRNQNVETLLSTRAIVQVCELAAIFKESGEKDYLPTAIYHCLFSGLRERENQAWNEAVRMVFNVNLQTTYGNADKNIFYA
jgi:MoxR-like ATPase